jgi:EAL domain-containing protein (putative c-di-GMP-specific phosphodiesterase class I)/FixJ family two-component response regulator
MNSTKILILEDHSLTRQMLNLAFRRLGYVQVFTADCGEQAFGLLKVERKFDVLVCDIQMPGIDGLTFLRKAREFGNITALIVFSEIATDLRQAIQQLGRLLGYQVLGDLRKPFSRPELEMLMARYRPLANGVTKSAVANEYRAEVVQEGLANGEFVPYYQPKIDLKTLTVVGAEVLVRWQHPDQGLLTPGDFLDVVIQVGCIDELTRSLTQQSLRFLHEQNLLGQLSLSINLEASQLASTSLLENISRLLTEERVPARNLILEVTESGLMLAPITSIENVVRLRLLGCGISIDDFGAGFSSLQRVCEMPCTELKLDASFVNSMVHNSRVMAAVGSVLRLAENLGIQLVAEGIETQEQLNVLQGLECPVGQGYFFSPPLRDSLFVEWLLQYKEYQAGLA